jgi:hypothetical protein
MEETPPPLPYESPTEGRGATVNGSGYSADLRHTIKKKQDEGIPWLKIMIAIIILILMGVAYLVFSGYYTG